MRLSTSVKLTTFRIRCLVCPQTDTNLVSVLDCARDHNAVIFDNKHAYIIIFAELRKLHRHMTKIADVRDEEYILKTRFPSSPTEHHPKALISTNIATTVTATQNPNPSPVILKMRNPRSKQEHRVVILVPLKRNRGRRRKHPPPTESAVPKRPRWPRPSIFTPLEARLDVATTPHIYNTAAHWHQTMKHAPTQALRDMANDPTSVVPPKVARKIPAQLACSS